MFIFALRLSRRRFSFELLEGSENDSPNNNPYNPKSDSKFVINDLENIHRIFFFLHLHHFMLSGRYIGLIIFNLAVLTLN